jgi:hypothetical protein
VKDIPFEQEAHPYFSDEMLPEYQQKGERYVRSPLSETIRVL